MPEKDTFGDKLRDKEHGEEEQHFAKRDRELLQKMRGATQPADQMRAQETEQRRCPNCGKQLERGSVDDIVLEKCACSSGVWFGRDEIAKLSQHDSESFLGRLFRRILVRNPH